jgi:hypothetical protein
MESNRFGARFRQAGEIAVVKVLRSKSTASER